MSHDAMSVSSPVTGLSVSTSPQYVLLASASPTLEGKFGK
jgi:hypothetical protein